MKSNIFIVLYLYNFLQYSFAIENNQKNTEYWNELSKDALMNAKKYEILEKKAKNVILFLGDGMGISTITAARIYKQQLFKDRRIKLSFENFENIALINTANLDYITPDSAGTGTAYVCGVKANKGTLGVNGHVKFGSNDCDAVKRNSVDSYLQWAINANKSAGFVTTAEVTDATPAATYSHSSNRDYYLQHLSNCTDIAKQLIENEPGKSLNVIFGGGRRRFLLKNKPNEVGDRDDVNLIEKWKLLKEEMKVESKFIRTKDELLNLNINDTDYVLGLFSQEDMQYEQNRQETNEPSLKDMTEKAIKILSKNPNGFAMLVEGAKIDKAHHKNQGYYSLSDTLAFDEAIEKALSMVDLKETLVIVTADHSHGFVISGYSKWEESIFAFSDKNDNKGIPYTALLYASGPNARARDKETIEMVTNKNYKQNALIELYDAAHGGEDVGAYATGPFAHLLRSSQEQTFIAHLIGYATCIGNYTNEPHCQINNSQTSFSIRLCPTTIPIILLIMKYLFIF